MFILAQTIPSLVTPHSCDWKQLISQLSVQREMFKTEYLTVKKKLILFGHCEFSIKYIVYIYY